MDRGIGIQGLRKLESEVEGGGNGEREVKNTGSGKYDWEPGKMIGREVVVRRVGGGGLGGRGKVGMKYPSTPLLSRSATKICPRSWAKF